MMQYVQNKENVISLKETDGNGELVHKEILVKDQNAEAVDTIQ